MMIDQFSDPSFRRLAQRILDVPEFEELIKKASLDPAEHAALPDSAFAWEDRRLFPIHTPEQAALSYLYATDKTASVPADVIETLKDSLKAYGIGLEVAMNKEAAAPVEDLGAYILPEQKRWYVDSAESVKFAEYALHNYGKELPLLDQVQAATRLVKKAQMYQQNVEPATAQLAGLTVSDLDVTRNWVEVRSNLAPSEFTTSYTKIASAIGKVGSRSTDRDSLVKLATTLHELDASSGLNVLYGKKIPSAMGTVFNSTKIAGDRVDIAGVDMSLSKLASLPKETYSDVFGDDILPEITTGGELDQSKIATVVPTMPLDLLRVFTKQVRNYTL